MNGLWTIEDSSTKMSSKQSLAAKFTLSNGYIGCRGFLDEDVNGIDGLGGIYIAGVFNNKDSSDAVELVNIPNFLNTPININGKNINSFSDEIDNYKRFIDMRKATSYREYIRKGSDGGNVRFKFERFVSKDNFHVVGQMVELCSINKDVQIDIAFCINSDVSNLNMLSTEPLPIQPGRVHLKINRQVDNAVEVETVNTAIKVAIGQVINVYPSNKENIKCKVVNTKSHIGQKYSFVAKKEVTYRFCKTVFCYTSLDNDAPFIAVNNDISTTKGYLELHSDHCKKWEKIWNINDIKISGRPKDQLSIRYSIFHLIQASPIVVKNVSIGARGLTGEMYGGAVFWDTEIFILPFYCLNFPETARNLLIWRHTTIKQSKLNAQRLWFKGAKYAWESGPTGIEHTNVDCGAFYAIHIVADIAYSICKYLLCTNDDLFLCDYGMEILIESSRFWASRANYDNSLKKWSIMAVRGPNEYGNVVNNNFYTNMMARENLYAAVEKANYIKLNYTAKWRNICDKTKLVEDEITNWTAIADLIHIPYDPSENIYLEDETYNRRIPFDIKKGKPTAKRVIDSTLPYEALTMYQITKQSDVVTLMNLFPEKFSFDEKKKAWEYYEPRTVHDSSLSYAPYSILAARLGIIDKALDYFRQSAYIDLDDLKMNSISGLHFANFGGTWQAVLFGFVGLQLHQDGVKIEPNIPDDWGNICLHIYFKDWLIYIEASNTSVRIESKICGKNEFFISTPYNHIYSHELKSPYVKATLNKPQFKAVIFDLDGVIVDTAKYHYQAWKTIAEKEGIYFDEEINERLKGVSRAASLEILLEKATKHYTKTQKDKLVEEKNNTYLNLLKFLTPKNILPGVLSLLKDVRKNEVKVGVCSASQNTDLILERTGIKNMFDVIISGKDVSKSKPDPEGINKTLLKLGVKPCEAALIEDALAGIESGIKAGTKTIGIGEKLLLSNADCVLPSTKDLNFEKLKMIFFQ